MNFIPSIFTGRKNSIVAGGIFVALILIPQAIRAQTSAATNALQFSDGGVVALNQPDLPPPWTAEMWVNRADASGASAALLNSSAAGLKLEQFESPNRNVGVTVYGVGDYYFNYTAPTNTWTHLAFVGTSSGVSLYVNGVLTDSLAVPISLPLTQLGNLAVDYLNATVDEVSVWNIARSAGAIQSSYQFPTTNSQPGLALLWHFDETSGSVAIDSSGNNYNGAISAATRVNSTAPIYLQTLTVASGGGPISLPFAVTIANGIGNMIINFNPFYAGSIREPDEMVITNNMTIDGSALSPPVTFITQGGRHFDISPNINVTISGINLSSGLAKSGYPTNSMGGSISNAGNLTLNNVVFIQNQAVGANAPSGLAGNGTSGQGGAIFNSSTGNLTINRCTFTQNTATGGNGSSGNSMSGNGGSAYGGAIYNSGRLTANFSSFYGQTNTGGLAAQVSGPGDASVSGSALGGAIYNDTHAITTINECTLTSNTVSVPGAAKTVGSALGGAIYSAHSLAINQSTLAGNILTVTNGGALSGGSVYQTGMATIFNSVIGPDSVPQTLGSAVLTGMNLIDGLPALAPLANYGGPTLTMPLMAGSPGVDAGADSATNLFATDQRGEPRLYGAHVDIGAVESIPPIVFNLDAAVISSNTTTGTYSVQLSVTASTFGAPATVNFESGGIPFNDGTFSLPGSATATNLSITGDFARGYRYYLTALGSNIMGSYTTPMVQLFTPPFSTDIPGDLNGNGFVTQADLNQVYKSYLGTSPYLLMTNAIGLGQSNVTFGISNGIVLSYTVQVSTDLVTWTSLGPAATAYNFTDTNAPAAPARYYRLVSP